MTSPADRSFNEATVAKDALWFSKSKQENGQAMRKLWNGQPGWRFVVETSGFSNNVTAEINCTVEGHASIYGLRRVYVSKRDKQFDHNILWPALQMRPLTAKFPLDHFSCYFKKLTHYARFTLSVSLACQWTTQTTRLLSLDPLFRRCVP